MNAVRNNNEAQLLTEIQCFFSDVNPLDIYLWMANLEEVNQTHGNITFEDLQNAKDKVEQHKCEEARNIFVTKAVTLLQGRIRGYIVRKELENRRKAVLVIQKWWRSRNQKKLNYFEQHVSI